MNKIYKLVWSKVRNAWVVTSEIAKGHGKESSSGRNGKRLKLAVMTAILGGCFMTAGISPVAALTDDQQAVYDAVMAELNAKRGVAHYFSVNSDDKNAPEGTNYDNNGATGKDAIAIGKNAVSEGPGSIAIGKGSKVFNTNTSLGMAIGDGAEAAHGSIVIGKNARDYDTDPKNGVFGIFIGSEAKSFGGSAQTVLGYSGQAKGQGSTAIGSRAHALGGQSSAVGEDSQALQQGAAAFGAQSIAEFDDSTALGSYANGRGNKSVASGNKSVAAGHNSVAIGYQSFAHNGFIDEDAYKALSPDEQKKYFEASGLDGYFLKDTADGNDVNKIGHTYLNTAVGSYSRADKHATTLGGATSAKEEGTAVGTYAKASQKGAASLGYKAKGNVENGVALGAYSVADREKGKIGYVLGGDNSTLEKALETIGQKAKYDELIGKIDPLKDEYNGLLKAYLDAPAKSAEETTAKQKLDKWKADHPDFLSAVKEKQQMIGAWQSGSGAVSVGKAGATRQITNVAAGSEDTDAVNVAQLKALDNKVTDKLKNAGVHYFSVNSDDKNASGGTNWNNDGATGEDAIAIGRKARAYGLDSQSMGENAWSIGNYSQAWGYYALAGAEEGIDKAAYDALSEAEKENYTLRKLSIGGEDKSLYYRTTFKEYTNDEFKALSEQERKDLTTNKGYGYHSGKKVWTPTPRAIAIGHLSKAIGAATVAVGNLAEATGIQSTAIGTQANASGGFSFAAGDRAKAQHKGTIAIGMKANASGKWSTAVGSYAEASGEWGTALGLSAKAQSENGVALGASTLVDKKDAVSLGYKAKGKVESGVALGAYSVADREKGKIGYALGGDNSTLEKALESIGQKAKYEELTGKIDPLKDEYNGLVKAYQKAPANSAEETTAKQKLDTWIAGHPDFLPAVKEKKQMIDAWQSGNGAVSVGSAGASRQITNVAAGTEDTDAVNVAQLKALDNKVAQGAIHYVSVTPIDKAQTADSNYFNDGAKGDGGIAIGQNATSQGRGIAMGYKANATPKEGATLNLNSFEGIAIGQEAHMEVPGGIAIGLRAKVEGTLNTQEGNVNEQGTVALGTDSHAKGNGAAAFGWKAKGIGEGAMAFGQETKAGMAGAAFGGHANAAAGAVAMGWQANAHKSWTTSIGTSSDAKGESSTALGGATTAEAEGSTAVGFTAVAKEVNSIALGAGAVANTKAGEIGYIATGESATFEEALTTLDKKEDYDKWTATVNASKAEYDNLTQAFNDASKDKKAEAKAALDKWKEQHQDFVKALEAKSKLEATWRATKAAVSVGADGVDKAGNRIIESRQITNVAAGTQDTDAVNVAQLKVVNTKVDKNAQSITELTTKVDGNTKNITDINQKIENLTGSSDWTLAVARGDDSKTDSEATAEGDSTKVSGGTVTLKAGRGVKLKQDGTNVQIGLKFIDMDPAGYPFNDAKATGGGSLAVGQNSVAGAHQATAVGFDTKADEYGVALGTTSKAGLSAVAIGSNALANGEDSIAIGTGKRNVENDPTQGYRKVDSDYAIAIGASAAIGEKSDASSAVGYYAEIAQSEWSNAFGGFSKIENSKYASTFGTASKVENAAHGTALGSYSKVQGAVYGTALGTSSSVQNAAHGTALGSNARVIGAEGGVAIGAHSVAERKASMIGYNPVGDQWNDLKDYLEKTGQKDAFVQATAKVQAAYQAWEKDQKNPELLANYYQAKAEQNKIINTWAGTQGAVSIGNEEAGFTRQLTGLAAGTLDTDAVNVAQLKVVNEKADKNATDITNLTKTVNANGKATKVTVDGKEENGDGNLKLTKKTKDGQTTYDLSLNDELTIGKDGKDGKIGINGKDGKSAEITVGKGKDGVDGTNGEDGITRIIYKDKDNKTHEVATLDDGLKFKGDNGDVVIRKLNTQLNITGGITDEAELSNNNIGVVGTAGDKGGMAVKLSKKLKGLTSAEFVDGDKVTNITAQTITQKDGDNITNITGGNVTITRKEGTVNLWELNQTVNNIKQGTTDVSSWKLQANGEKERIIKKDSIVNFKNGANTEVTVNGNDVTVDLNANTKKQISDNTTNINNIDQRVTTIENNIDQKIEGSKIKVEGDTTTGVKAEAVKDGDKVTGYKVSLEQKVKVGNVTIDGTDKKGEIMGLTNKTLDSDDFATKGRAATEEQLKAAMDKAVAQGTTTVKAGDKNISVVKTENKNEYTVGLAKDITVNSVTAKTVKADEYKVGDKTYINKDGINANGNKITNVADGVVSKDSKDAVNGSQLFATNQMVVNNMNQINNLREESREGDALGAAMAALKPLDFDPYQRNQVMAGVGYYRGKEAVALGLAHYKNEDLMIHGGLAYAGNSELMANVGVSYRFGSKDDRDIKHDRNLRMPQYDKGPISSVYILQDEVERLTKENKEANDRIAALEAKLEKVLEKVK